MVIFTQTHGEAGALEWCGVGRPIYSGHHGGENWGPPPAGTGPVVVVAEQGPAADFAGCRLEAVVANAAGVHNEERGTGIYVCTGRPALMAASLAATVPPHRLTIPVQTSDR